MLFSFLVQTELSISEHSNKSFYYYSRLAWFEYSVAVDAANGMPHREIPAERRLIRNRIPDDTMHYHLRILRIPNLIAAIKNENLSRRSASTIARNAVLPLHRCKRDEQSNAEQLPRNSRYNIWRLKIIIAISVRVLTLERLNNITIISIIKLLQILRKVFRH